MKAIIIFAVSIWASNAFAGEWIYSLYSMPESSSESGFWNIYLNDANNAAEVPGLNGSAYFCVREKFHCIDSEVLRFAVPREGHLAAGQEWVFKGIKYTCASKTKLSLMGLEHEVWLIEGVRAKHDYANYLYSAKYGLIAFTMIQDASFQEGEFYLLSSKKGFAALEDYRGRQPSGAGQ